MSKLGSTPRMVPVKGRRGRGFDPLGLLVWAAREAERQERERERLRRDLERQRRRQEREAKALERDRREVLRLIERGVLAVVDGKVEVVEGKVTVVDETAPTPPAKPKPSLRDRLASTARTGLWVAGEVARTGLWVAIAFASATIGVFLHTILTF